MSLHDVIQSDASLVFANASDFGETATYKPKLYSEGDARPNRSIVVVIDRQAFEVVSEDQQTATPVWEIQVVNSSTLGISSDELDLGGMC
jgi:endo-beta-N-acetylglucosaminidase D